MLYLRGCVVLLDAGDELCYGWLSDATASDAITVFKSEHEAKDGHIYRLFWPESSNRS